MWRVRTVRTVFGYASESIEIKLTKRCSSVQDKTYKDIKMLKCTKRRTVSERHGTCFLFVFFCILVSNIL